MGKKAKKHTNLASKKRRPSTGSLAALAPKAKPNAFETIAPKRKFDILGRRTKGDKKNLAVVRGEGIQKRKNTLLQEFKKSGKSNSFVDRRFGERSEGMTAEEKAIARFQRVRQAQVKKSGRFNLEEEGADEQLTHHGQSLSNIDSFADGGPSDDDELPSHAARELDAMQVRQLHFGGGDDKEGDGDAEVQKSKKEAMEELIAKSKYYKGLKKKEKEEDADALDALDATFRELSSKGEFLTGGQKMERPAVREKPDDYDRNVRELAQDVRATPGQRAQTAEEAAAAAAERLEELERQRVKRMRSGGGDDDDGDGDADGPKGGFAARRAKRKKEEQEAGNGEDEDELDLDSDGGDKSDDEGEGSGSGSEAEEGSEEEEEDEEGASGSDEEGSEIELDLDDLDPLQKRLKEVSAQMRPDLKAGWERLKKLMVADSAMMKECNAPDLDDPDAAQSQSDGSDGDSEEEDDEEEEGSDGDSEEEEEEEEEEAPKKKKGDKEKAAKAEKAEKATKAEKAEKAAKAEKAEKAKKAAEAVEAPSSKGKAERSASGAAAESTSNSNLPFTFKAPATHADLAALVAKHCVGAVEGEAAALRLMVQRIRTCNAIHLNTDNRYAMQLFYGVLMQHFDSVVGQSPPALSQADALVPHLYEMAKEVPLYAATAARARLSKIQTQALATQRQSGCMSWPSVRALLLLRLFTLVFPPSDHRHPVLAPAAIVVGGLLGQCPLADSADAAAALFLCGIAHTLAAPSKRVAVEAMEALTLLLCAAAPPTVAAAALPEHLRTRLMGRPLHLTAADGKSKSAAAAAAAGLPLRKVLAAGAGNSGAESGGGKKWLGSPSFRAAAVAAALQAATQFVQLYAQLPCAPELVYELAAAAQRMGCVPVAAVEQHRQALLTAVRRCVDMHASRTPLRMHPKRQEALRVFNPKFEEEGYVPGRDYDPDKIRAEQRKLKKIIKKEQKGAARELRKDNYFLADEKAKEVAVYEEGRTQKTNEVMAMLQKQESDFKSGGQGGMKLFGKKKK